MKKFELTLNGGSKYVLADSFKQAGSDVTFYVEGACTGLVRLSNGDCVFQVEAPDKQCPDCGYKPGERAGQKSASHEEATPGYVIAVGDSVLLIGQSSVIYTVVSFERYNDLLFYRLKDLSGLFLHSSLKLCRVSRGIPADGKMQISL